MRHSPATDGAVHLVRVDNDHQEGDGVEHHGQHQAVGAELVSQDEELGWKELDGSRDDQHQGSQEVCQGEQEEGAQLAVEAPPPEGGYSKDRAAADEAQR